MGWFDKSSSSTSVVNNLNQNVGADNGATAINAQTSNYTVNALDGGAIKSALDFGSVAGKNAFDFGRNSLDYASHVNDTAIRALSQTFEGATQQLSATTAKVIGQTTTDSGARIQSLIKTMGWFAAGIVLIWAFKK